MKLSLKIEQPTFLEPQEEDTYKEPIQILPGVYLGNQRNAESIETLERLNIRYVLNVAEEVDLSRVSPTIKYKKLSFGHQEHFLPWLNEAFQFVQEGRDQNASVLIHCQMGVSRSACIMIAYVMKTLQQKAYEAYEFVKAKSSSISPNFTLFSQLMEFEKQISVDVNKQP